MPENDPEIGEEVTIAFYNPDDPKKELVTRKVLIVYYLGHCVETGEEIIFGPEEVMVREDDQPKKEAKNEQ